MSTVIEEKVVSMEFDNQHFEKNVKTSMTTIDKLKEKLNFDGMANSMQGLGDAAKKIDMGPLSDGIETVRAKFSAMQIMGITALQNITNSAINYGKRIVSSLTIDPIKTGLQEYETQIGAIQTILANTKSKGSTLEDVNTALDELNKYADRTIYNFTEMTKNIGTFTAAGVELDTSVSAIKGIANLAAVSGSTSQQASTAMYQLSQALAAGKIRLMDWNSVVNAGMGGEIFQESIKETARLHGVAIDDMIKNEGSFRETLKNDWFTAEILTETLSKFTGDLSEAQLKSKGYNDEQIKGIMELGEMANSAATDVKTFTQLMDTLKESAQSGWAQTWRIMIGDFEEAKGLWSQVSKSIGDIINDSAEARNNVLKEAFGSGWNKFIDKGIFDKDSFLYQVEQSAKKAGISLDELKEKFNGKFNSDALKEALKTGLIDSDMMSDALNNLTSLYKIMSPEQLKAKGFTDEQVKQLVAFNEEIQNGRTSMKNLVDEIAKLSGRELLMKAFGNIGQAIGNIVSPIKEAFVEIFDLKDASVVADRIYKIVEAFKNFTDHLKLNEKQMNNLKRTFKGVFAVFDIFLTVIKSVAGIITRLLDSVFGLDIGILGLTGTIGDYLVQFRDFIKSSNSLEIFADTVTEKFGKAVEGVKSFIASLKEKIKMPQFESFGDFLTTVWEKMKFIGGKIGEVFGQIWQGIKDIVSSIDLEKAFDNLASILFGAGVGAAGGGIYFGLVKFSEMIGNFGEVLSSFNPLNFVSDFLDRFRESTEKFSSETLLYTIKTVAKAVALLVAYLAVLSLLDPEKVETGVGAIITMFSALLIATALLSKINFTKTVSSFSEKFKTAFGKGNLSKNVTTVNKSVGAMLAIAASVALLAVTLKVIATMEWEDIAKGLTVMTVALGELLLATWVISKIKITKAYRGATKILTLAGVLALVSLSLKFLATMDWKGMGVSLISMAGVFTILTAVTAIISKVRFSKTATATSKMVALAGMFTIMAASLRFLATMDWTGMGIALISMLSTFVILTSAAAIISKIKFTKTATATSKMVALAGAFAIMGVSLKVLSTMNWAGMGISLISMTGAFTALLGTLAIISKAKLSATGKDVLVLTGIAGVLLVMAGTLKLLSTLDWKGMGVALVSLTATVGLLTLLLTALKFIKVDLKNLVPLIAIAGSMIALAGALALLTPSLMALEKVRWENLGKAVTILGGLMAVLAGLGLLMTLSKASMGAVPVLAASLILLATSFAILAPALKMLNDVNWGAIGMAVVALLSFVVILGVAAGLMSAFPIAIAAVAVLALTLLSAAPACLGFSVAMIALTDSLERLSNIKFLDLAKGVLALSTAFLLMSAGVVAIGLLGPFALTASVALLAMATSLWLVSLALAGIANAYLRECYR